MKLELLQSLIDRARQEEMGIMIETNNLRQLEVAFATQNPVAKTEFSLIRFDDTHIALIKKSVELDYDLS